MAGFLQDHLGLAFSEEEILEACAILDTNAFEMKRGRIKFRGLFPLVSMMAHDCVPNTRHVFDKKDAILLFATVDIKQGATLTATYTQPLWNTMTRRAHLRSAKCFDCTCQRCADPQEMGTFLSAIKCTNCTTGKLKYFYFFSMQKKLSWLKEKLRLWSRWTTTPLGFATTAKWRWKRRKLNGSTNYYPRK